jgi:uncharacterized protein YoxC
MEMTFHIWELGILLIGIAFVIVSVYLVTLLKSANKTLEDSDQLIAETSRILIKNEDNFNEMIEEAKEMTKNINATTAGANEVVSDTGATVKTAKHFIMNQALQGVKAAQAVSEKTKKKAE